MNRITWKKNLTEALIETRGGSRLPMLMFVGQEAGSDKMLNEVLSDEKVVATVERETAPVLVKVEENQELAKRFKVDWTPAFVICDDEGNALERLDGYLPAEDFIPQFILSKGIADFHLQRHEDAISEFELIVDQYPSSDLVPEAEYYLGAATFKMTGETEKLSEVCHELIMTHPESPWTKRCSLWSHTTNQLRPFIGYDGGGSAGSGAY
jgi:hypothetical protein